eukprot:gnl/Dysnectes_brevis/1362_a1531_1241.p1 GENE.gnl/Dysnectes_brevis/1362_a1531_1241~~gnl/Dysnectes_brevis/1362_a1531_1241.p1  ORF type:complete len:525 (+),score=205.30 gnl/Dysnectes_brevis/1362_a1531_1241:55-1629(+)
MTTEERKDVDLQPDTAGMAKIKPEFLRTDITSKKEPKESEQPRGKRRGKKLKKGYQSRAPLLCRDIAAGKEECAIPGGCRSIHDPSKFEEVRLPSIPRPCHFYTTYGSCPYGLNCRYSHEDPAPEHIPRTEMINAIPSTTLATLRKKQYRAALPRPGHVSRPLDLRGKLILAPMCTVGMLPFRRLCTNYGADVTVAPMAMATSILRGERWEGQKLKRHPDEKVFGIQIAGRPHELARVAEFLGSEISQGNMSADFIDINAACPQDVATSVGAGAMLCSRPTALWKAVDATADALEPYGIPLTAKIRAGDLWGSMNGLESLAAGKDTHSIDRLSGLFVHGRTARQRYSRSADWSYVSQMREAMPEGVPLLGNGDVYMPADVSHMSGGECEGLLVGRGALVKPWIFQELKEGREIDMTSGARMRMLHEYAGYLLDHFGGDSRNVETARGNFLENWNFMCRYISPALMSEPHSLNQRAPAFNGRDPMETLMGSEDPNDWVKVSEHLFGTPPIGWSFVPRHKSRGYAS